MIQELRAVFNRYKEALKEKWGEIIYYFTPKEKITSPYLVDRITINEAKVLLKPLCDPKHIYLSDWNYGLTSPAMARKFNRLTKVQYRNYSKQYDCDNFSFALHSYWNEQLENFAFGIAWSNNHAFNIMIDHLKKVWVVEPQNNQWYTLEQAKKSNQFWPIRMVMM